MAVSLKGVESLPHAIRPGCDDTSDEPEPDEAVDARRLKGVEPEVAIGVVEGGELVL